jgi:hypothetical protein
MGIFLLLIGFIATFRIVRFLTTPFLKKIGFYKYYSPMFMTMPLGRNYYDLHLGTSWDLLKRTDLNPRLIITHLAEGLICLSEAIEKNQISMNSKFKGNTFYLNGKSIERFGFSTRKMNWFEFILFVINYTELCILNSIVKKKLYFVPWKNVLIVTCSAKDIIANKVKYISILDLMERSRNKYSLYTKPGFKNSLSKTNKSAVKLNLPNKKLYS